MKILIYCTTAAAFLVLLFVWLMTQLHYRIGSRHLKILLFGIPLRRVGLDNIVYASKHNPKGLAERWHNTLKSSHRLLTIERERGIFKNICITPRNRYVFLADLRDAVRRVNPKCEWAKYNGPEEGTTTLNRSREMEVEEER
jgi:hypothetical protein